MAADFDLRDLRSAGVAPGVDGDDPFLQFSATAAPGGTGAPYDLLPLALHVQPLAPTAELRTLARDALRCGACGAYASPRFGGAYGCCAVCGHATSAAWGLPDGGRGRVDLPELDVYALEYVQPSAQPDGGLGAALGAAAARPPPPAVVLLLDEGASAAQLCDLRAALPALLDALDPDAALGVLGFGAVVSAWDLERAATTLAADDDDAGGGALEAHVLAAGAASLDADATDALAAELAAELRALGAEGGGGGGVLAPARAARLALGEILDGLISTAEEREAGGGGADEGGPRCLGTAVLAALELVAMRDADERARVHGTRLRDARAAAAAGAAGAPHTRPPPPPPAGCRLGAEVLVLLAGRPRGGPGGLAPPDAPPGASGADALSAAAAAASPVGWLGRLLGSLLSLGAEGEAGGATLNLGSAASTAASAEASAAFWRRLGARAAAAATALSVCCGGYADFELSALEALARGSGGAVALVREAGTPSAASQLRGLLRGLGGGRLGSDARVSVYAPAAVAVDRLLCAGLFEPDAEADGPGGGAAALAGPGAAACASLGRLTAATALCAFLTAAPPALAASGAAGGGAAGGGAAARLVVQVVIDYTCARTGQRRTRVLSAPLRAPPPVADAAARARAYADAVQPTQMALALAKRWAADALGDGRALSAEAGSGTLDAHARALGVAFGARAAASRGPRALGAAPLAELARLLYAARRCPAFGGCVQDADDCAAAAAALAAAEPTTALRMLEAEMLAVRASALPAVDAAAATAASAAPAAARWSFAFARLASPHDLALRSAGVYVVDAGAEIAIWVGEDASSAAGDGPPWLPALLSEASAMAEARTPPASVRLVREGQSMERWVLARLEPTHNDTHEAQEAAMPELAAMDPAEREALRARFHLTDDLSLRQWGHRLALDVPPRGGARRPAAAAVELGPTPPPAGRGGGGPYADV